MQAVRSPNAGLPSLGWMADSTTTSRARLVFYPFVQERKRYTPKGAAELLLLSALRGN